MVVQHLDQVNSCYNNKNNFLKALAVAVGIASQKERSEVILCTGIYIIFKNIYNFFLKMVYQMKELEVILKQEKNIFNKLEPLQKIPVFLFLLLALRVKIVI